MKNIRPQTHQQKQLQEAYHFQLNVTAKERNIKRGIGVKMGV